MGGTLPAVAAGSLKANDLAWLGVKYREHWALDRVVVRPPQLRKWAKKTIISRGTKDKELASTVQPFSNKNTVDIARRNEDGVSANRFPIPFPLCVSCSFSLFCCFCPKQPLSLG